MAALDYSEYFTKANYIQWQGDWELIGGVAYAMAPSPMVTHQSVATKIASELEIKTSECKKCLTLNEIDYEISNDTIVRPDVLLICKPIDETVDKAPDVIFEVLSASTARRDETVKFDLYQKEGVSYYVLVHPQKKVAKVYRLSDDGRFVKQGDFTDESFGFETKSCLFDFDFGKIWRSQE